MGDRALSLLSINAAAYQQNAVFLVFLVLGDGDRAILLSSNKQYPQ
jgi:hypothetical protein